MRPRSRKGWGLVLLSSLILFVYFHNFQKIRELNDANIVNVNIVDDSSVLPQSQQQNNKAALDIQRKDGTHVILNIGSNDDPIVPRVGDDDPCTISIAFEPIVAHTIPPHPGLHVVSAAVTAEPFGLTSMYIYNKRGVSSSLSRPTKKADWNRNGGALKVVPTVSFRSILESLQNFEIDLIMTDMQGHDFAAVSSVGGLIKEVGVKRLVTEVYKDNVVSYEGAKNDICRDWLPHMQFVGYVFEGLTRMKKNGKEALVEGFYNEEQAIESCQALLQKETTAGFAEYNAYWRLEGQTPVSAVGLLKTHYLYPNHSPWLDGPKFTEEQYAACRQ